MELLREKIDASGYKQNYIAEQLGISRFGLADKVKNPERWKMTEVIILVKLLHLSPAETQQIFGL